VKKIVVIGILILFSGCIFQSLEREGFKEEDLTTPFPYYVTYDAKPLSNSLIHFSYSYEIIWEINDLYAFYNGAFKIKIRNTGNTKLFVYGFAIKINDMEEKSKWKDGKFILPGEEKDFSFAFKCPPPGIHQYKLGIYFMAGRGNRWYDYGLKFSDEKRELEIKGFENATYRLYKNYYLYFDKINELVDTNDATILQRANQIAKYGNGYNIANVCAIFDWIRENIQYKNDTDDEWTKPSIALYEGGDCEEFAMLMAAMVEAIGGTARIYLTDNHAFASIYIGKNVDLLECIDTYYHANLSYALFHDKFGYWIVADPLASTYLGGLPVGGVVTGGEGKIYEWSIKTNKLYSIDVMRD